MTEKIALLNQKLSTMNNNESKINQTVNKTMHINVKKITRMLLECYLSIPGRSSSFPYINIDSVFTGPGSLS